jgi:TonB family protein
MRLSSTCVSLILAVALPGETTAKRVDAVTRIALQNPVRIALVGFAHSKGTDGSPALESAFTEALARDSRAVLIDHSMIQPALTGFGYDGSINMGKDEARRLGAVISCDFFIIGKAEALTRSARENESHEEAFAGVIIIDGRTGALAVFDFISEKAVTRERALNAVASALGERASGYIDRMIQARKRGLLPASNDPANSGSTGAEFFEDMPDEDSPRAAGFTPPQFLGRVKPNYTSEAEQADITATVEVMVMFRSNGEVGGIETTRWAGFGLEDSAERAIRQLKFKPATRDGKPVGVRAMIRYNFRRVSEPSQQPELPAPKPPEKPDRDLRQLFKPTYRRP